MKKFLCIAISILLMSCVACTGMEIESSNSSLHFPTSLSSAEEQNPNSENSQELSSEQSLDISTSSENSSSEQQKVSSSKESSSLQNISSSTSSVINAPSSSSKETVSSVSSTPTQSSTSSSSSAPIVDPSVINLTEQTAHSAITYSDNCVTVNSAGTFTFTGNYSGYMLVNGVEGDITIILDGVNISTTTEQTTSAILFAKNSYNRTLVIKDGSTNYLADSTGDIADVGEGAVIKAKKCNLTISGGGSLELMANGEDTTGIKVKKDLIIDGPTIKITSTNNGIKAENTLQILNSNIEINAGNDGIKADNDPSDETEATTFAATETAGYLYIENSSITVVSTDNGICASNKMIINNNDNNTINVTTNGGTPETISGNNDSAGMQGGGRPGGNWGGGSSSSTTTTSTTDGKAILVSGTKLTTTDTSGTQTETFYNCGFASYYPLIIKGGIFNINSNDDAIHCNGDVTVSGGTLFVTSGDDGLHADNNATLTGGSLNVTKSYEALEGKNVYISGGNHTLYANDDGINAAYAEDTSISCTIEITGGTTLVNADGDSLDAGGGDMGQENKGYINLYGGTVYVCGTTSGGNGAIDSSTSATVNGANIIVMMGSNTMESTLNGTYSTYNTSYSAGKTVTVKDSSGNIIMQVTNPKSFGKMYIACTTSGWTYTVS